ncbi:MAG: polyprenyl synthetase family protein [Myxococcota bacterium]|nr:polyprenyl synthetase family protein [Myxococcota bacterium]
MNEPARTVKAEKGSKAMRYGVTWRDIEPVVVNLLETSTVGAISDEPTALILNPLREFFAAPGKGLRAELVHLGWSLAGHVDPPPSTLVVGIELLHAGSLIIDDVQDSSLSRRGRPCMHRTIGIGPALNLGNLLYFMAVEAIGQVDGIPRARSTLNRIVNQTLIRCHQGQAMDLCLKVHALPQTRIPELVRQTTTLKTGALTALALNFGAVLADLSSRDQSALYQLGEALGVCLQMYDDLSGIVNPDRANKGMEDLSAARPTWPWAWLAHQLDPDTFRALTTQLKTREDDALSDLKREMAGYLSNAASIIHARLDGTWNDFLALKPDGGEGIEDFVNRLKTGYL